MDAGGSAWEWPVRFATTSLRNREPGYGLIAKGTVTVETDMTDIGTGTYTIIAQTAAEMMGLPLHKVVVRLGDSTYPVSAGSGGQWGANNSTSGVFAACVKLREAVSQKLGFNSDEQSSSTVRSAPAIAACRSWRRPATRTGRRGRYRIWRSRQEISVVHFRRAFCRGRCRCRNSRNPRAPHARRMRGRAHPQPQIRPQPSDRSHDHGRWRSADGGTRG